MGSDRGGNAAGSGYLTAPVAFFAAQIAAIGVSTAWALIAAGEILGQCKPDRKHDALPA